MRRVIVLAGLLICCLQAASAKTQWIINGGFELGNAGEWQLSGAGAFITNGALADTGVGYLSMGNVPGAAQVVYQTIQFPTNLIEATFSFNYETLSSDISASDDLLSVYILDTNQNVLAYLGQTSNTTPTSGYNLVRTNLSVYAGHGALSSYAGKTVEVYFHVTTDPTFGNLTTFNIDNVSLLIATTADISPNDNFSNSITLQTAPETVTATNTYDSKEPGEPNIAGNAGGHSLWWDWTATQIGTASLNTSGSTFTTLLGVYTGTSVNDLTPVAANNGNSANGAARLGFKTTPGTQYHIAVDGYNGQSGTVVLRFGFSLDTKAPTVTIASPAAGAKLTNSTVLVKGKASDNVDVALVEFRLENAAGTNDYQVATGTNTWSATVTNLIPGPNTIRIRATDTSGNVSDKAAREVTFVVVSPLTLTVTGSGAVIPPWNGRLLGVGSTYLLTARPQPDSIFAGWTGDITASAPVLRFTMQTNLVLQANFIPNPFPPVAGVYEGLLYDTNLATHPSSGFLTTTVTSGGGYTAKLLLGGANYSFSGRFSAFGVASNSVAPKNLPHVTIQLALDLAGGGLSGEFSNGVWTAELNSFRAMPNPPAGNYTLLLPGADSDPAQPGGDGFGTVKVDKRGRVSFSGTLGDGTAASQSAIVTPGGQWPFYIKLYSGKGSIFGWLTFSNQTGGDITGLVDWFKLAQPGPFYSGGFTNQNDVEGSIYRFTNGVPVPGFANGAGEVSLAGGNLADSFTNPITLSPAGKVTNLGSNRLILNIKTASGLFTGSVVDPQTGRPIAISGAILEKQNIGGGVFRGTSETGSVTVQGQ